MGSKGGRWRADRRLAGPRDPDAVVRVRGRRSSLLTLVYFTFGSQATIVAAVLVTAFMVAMPFVWAYVVRNRHRDDAGTPQAH